MCGKPALEKYAAVCFVVVASKESAATWACCPFDAELARYASV